MALQDQLRELFLLDQQARGLRSRLDTAIRRQSAQKQKLDQLRQQEAELNEQVRRGEAKAKTLEHQSNDAEQRISKLREQMNTVTSNKEYSALLVEVNTLKIDKSKLEDQALEQMTEVDALRQRLAEVQQKLTDQARLVELAETEVAEARAEVGGRLDELTAQRDAAANALPADARQAFERTARTHEGEAMAQIQEEDRRRMEYTCGGCYMTLPIERVNTVMMRPDEITTCPNCGRILYVDQELKAAIGSK